MKTMGFLEPIYELLRGHGDKLDENITAMRNDISRVADAANLVLSKVKYDEFTTQANRAIVEEDGTALIELIPNDGFSWRTTRIALTGTRKVEGEEIIEGNCAVYVGSVAPENLIDVFRGTGITADDPKYFVPYTVPLTFHFYEQEPGDVVTVNMQAELLPSGTPRRATTGRDREHIDVPRLPVIPDPGPFLHARQHG